MDFGFSQEQELLRATARKFFDNECPSEFVRARMAEPAGVTDEFWAKLAEQGWLGLVYPETYGGSGLGVVDLTVLMEEMGRVVMPGPFAATVMLGGLAIREAGSEAQQEAWLPRIAAGEAKATLAFTEPNARKDAAAVTLPAAAARGGASPAPSPSSPTPIWRTCSSSRPGRPRRPRRRRASRSSWCPGGRPGST
jgi:alkylation response protein AidB-like acyl-CoA dehydrogenase